MQSLSFHRLPIILLSLAFLLFFNPIGSVWLLLGLFSLYFVTGGYRYLRVVLLTVRRDLRGLIFIIKVFITMRRYGNRGETVASLFERTAKTYWNKVAFVCEDVSWTFGDVSQYSNAVAHFLSSKRTRATALEKGDVVAVFMESRPEYIASWLGVCKLGCVSALINNNQRNDTLLHSINIANSKAIICGEELLPALAEIVDRINHSMPIYVVPKSEGPPSTRASRNSTSSCFSKVVGLSTEVMDLCTLEPFFEMGVFQSPPGDFGGTVLYIYTSGTTGLPKAAKITSSRYWYMCTAPHCLPKLSDKEVVYISLPIYHSNGGIVGVGQALIWGCTCVLRKKFSASQFWDDCVKYNCTAFLYIGEICRYLLAQPIRPSESAHRVRFAIGNGLRENIWTEFQTRFRIEHIVEFYGATEGNANAINYWDRVGAVGFTSRIIPPAYPIYLIKVDDAGVPIRDPRTGLCVQCQPDEPGELIGKIAKGNYLRRFDGYATAAETERKIVHDVFRKGDMYFRTGDILVMDELGYFFFRDRTGDTFRWRGENVSTQEVEAVVSSVTGLRDSAVYGVEVPGVEGRAGMAAIVDPHHELDITNGLAITLLKSLPTYGVPIFIRVMEQIPSTTTYKFVKGTLQKEAFNPESVGKDPLFYLDMTANPRRYVRINRDIYKKIVSGEIRL